MKKRRRLSEKRTQESNRVAWLLIAMCVLVLLLVFNYFNRQRVVDQRKVDAERLRIEQELRDARKGEGG